MTTQSETNADKPERKLSKQETEFHEAVNVRYAEATPQDKKVAADLMRSGAGIRKEMITSTQAAVIVVDHNLKNRDLNISKAHGFCGAMDRGEWKLNHQGIAAYPDGTLADGQHRMCGLALSSVTKPLPFIVCSDFDKDAIDTASPRPQSPRRRWTICLR